jgi:hypothetical protein
LSWLLPAGLVIIWAAFLLPRRSRSPASSVEEFERKMSLLAGTNKTMGRWVLMPRRGERFMGPRDRNRTRARRRRRHVFVALLDAIVITLLIGLVPPLRVMLFGTAFLVLLLIAYSALLVQVKLTESAAARSGNGRSYRSVAEVSRALVAVSNGRGARVAGNGHGFARNGNGEGGYGYPGNGYSDNGYAAAYGGNGYGRNGHGAEGYAANGHGNGDALSESLAGVTSEVASAHGNGRHATEDDNPGELYRLIDDDVHVIVRRAQVPEADEVASAAN